MISAEPKRSDAVKRIFRNEDSVTFKGDRAVAQCNGAIAGQPRDKPPRLSEAPRIIGPRWNCDVNLHTQMLHQRGESSVVAPITGELGRRISHQRRAPSWRGAAEIIDELHQPSPGGPFLTFLERVSYSLGNLSDGKRSPSYTDHI